MHTLRTWVFCLSDDICGYRTMIREPVAMTTFSFIWSVYALTSLSYLAGTTELHGPLRMPNPGVHPRGYAQPTGVTGYRGPTAGFTRFVVHKSTLSQLTISINSGSQGNRIASSGVAFGTVIYPTQIALVTTTSYRSPSTSPPPMSSSSPIPLCHSHIVFVSNPCSVSRISRNIHPYFMKHTHR